MQAISIKELREKMPLVRSEIAKGESFLVIYKSKPFAELKPIDAKTSYDYSTEEATEEDIERAALKDMEDIEYLSEQEVKYYLSLKPFKAA